MSPDGALHLFGAFALVLGLVVGSFLNVCIARMPEDRSIVSPPSHCPACGHRIRPYDNIPVLSWLVLRGRCRDCGTRISSLYPTVELLMGLLTWLVWRRVVRSPADLDLAHAAAFIVLVAFVGMLVAQTFIDLRHRIIQHEFSIYAVPLGIGSAVLLTWLGYADAVTWQQSVVGALAGASLLLFVMGAYFLVRREEGMGWGDVYLLAMIGSFVGFLPAIPFVIFVASVAGSVVGLTFVVLRRRSLRTALPFGPFLAMAAIVYVLHGHEWTARLFPGWPLLFGGS